MKRREKKSESLDIRLPYEQKREFMEATRKQGETASQALRRFIADYIEEARLTENPNPVQEITMTLARHRIKTFATAASAAVGVFAFTAMPSAADDSVFAHLDKNSDGFITEGEILPGNDADIIEKLDTDKSGGVSPAELKTGGTHIVINGKTSTEDGVTRKKVKVLKLEEGESAKLTTSDERKVVIRRSGDEEMSQEDLDALIKEAMTEAGLDTDIDIDIDVSDLMDTDS